MRLSGLLIVNKKEFLLIENPTEKDCFNFLLNNPNMNTKNYLYIPKKFKTNDDFNLKLVKKRFVFLEMIEKQTEEICLAAIKIDAVALRMVKKQTVKVCIKAMTQNTKSKYKAVIHSLVKICPNSSENETMLNLVRMAEIESNKKIISETIKKIS